MSMEVKQMEEKKIRFATVVSNVPLNFRASANVNGERLMLLEPGSTVEVLSKRKDWTKIRFKGTTGFVMTNYIETK